jgi:putative nucleotidyltransferase with HDIG domain
MDAPIAGMRDKIVSIIPNLRAMSPSSVRLIDIVKDPDHDLEELIDELEFDAGLTANILRWANSVYFRGIEQTVSIRDAAVRLGTRPMMNLITASCTAPALGRPVPGYELGTGGLLWHSMMVATGTDVIASECKALSPNHTFTAGLLHDIGKIVLGPFIKSRSTAIGELIREEQLPFDKAERAVFGIDHQEVGALILREWNIPEPIVEAVRWHHEPNEYEGEKLVVDLIHVSEMLTWVADAGSGIEAENYQIDDQASQRLGLDDSLHGTIIEAMLAELEKHQDILLPGSKATGTG